MSSHYFDHASTTPVLPEVVDAVSRCLADNFGNPNSIHSHGREARMLVDAAREAVAELLQAEDPQQIIFTSGATEANNLALRSGVAKFGAELCRISPFEHSSVREPAEALAFGQPAAPDFHAINLVDNETGLIQELPKGISWLHVDATQAVGKIDTDFSTATTVSCSAHKIGGPKGVGALFARDPYDLVPQLLGGGQESGLRSGTENVPGIVGFGVAARLAIAHRQTRADRAAKLREIVTARANQEPRIECLENDRQSPFILAMVCAGVLAETMVIELDAKGFCVSAGPACSTASTEPSPVLLARGLTKEQAMSTIRISFGEGNSEDSTERLVDEILRTYRKLRDS